MLLLAVANIGVASPVLAVRELTVDFSPFTVVAAPGESLVLPVLSGTLAGASVDAPEAVSTHLEQGSLLLEAPDKAGFYPVRITLPDGEQRQLQLFVAVPASTIENGYLNGYRMGPSPPGHPRFPELYRAPEVFIEVSEALLETPLSPHFTLRQFLCKQESGYPKYVALKESLLVLLEGLLEAVQEAGYDARTFGVISGYRTPWYNKSIGNVPNSRHVYGDAMDLYVDLDGDGRLDDLDGDGDHDLADVDILADIAEAYMGRPSKSLVFGGVGRYRKTHYHGGFVHVDTRGYAARW